MGSRRVIGALLVAAALGLGTLVSASGAEARTPGDVYTPPGPRVPLIVQVSTDAPAVVMPPGVPSARDEISVIGRYPGTTGQQLYCIVYGRGC